MPSSVELQLTPEFQVSRKTSFSGSDWSDPVTSLEHPSPQITGSAKKLRSDWDSDQRLFDLELIKEVGKSSISEFKFLYSREHSD